MDYCKEPRGGLTLKGNQTQWMNDATFFDYYTRLKELAINRFEWINLPGTCDARFLELILFEFGHALFFRHNGNDAFLTLQCAIGGRLNMYRIPIDRQAYAITGFIQHCTDLDSVIIYNNYLRLPTELTIRLYAERLTEIERSINVNIKGQKTPLIVHGNQQQQKTLQNVYRQWAGNEPIIFGDKSLGEHPLEVLKTDVPESYEKLMTAKTRIWNEAMTFLGFDSANTDKKERLVVPEVESNNQLLNAQRFTVMNARKEACKLINDLFATELDAPVDVRFRDLGGDTSWQDTRQSYGLSASQSQGNDGL